MNEPSPLVPQGSFESQARRKSHVRIAVFSILAIHVVVLGGLLILGCKRDDKGADTAGNPPLTNDLAVPAFGGTDVIATNAIAQALATNPGVTNTVTSPGISVPSTASTPPPTVPDAGAPIIHVIARGESFATLATKYGVTVKAIQEANPNLVPTRLQINDKVKIPPKTAALARPTPTADASDVYTVKTGDTLGKIATAHRTTVKELQSLNNLPTTQIRVGQKLKLPAASAPAAPGGIPPAQ